MPCVFNVGLYCVKSVSSFVLIVHTNAVNMPVFVHVPLCLGRFMKVDLHVFYIFAISRQLIS